MVDMAHTSLSPSPYLLLMQEMADDGASETIKAICSAEFDMSDGRSWWYIPEWLPFSEEDKEDDLFWKSVKYMTLRRLIEHDKEQQRIRFLKEQQ